MKNVLAKLLSISLLLMLFSCSEYKIIDAGYDADVDFRKYRSFDWFPINDTTETIYDNMRFRSCLKRDFINRMLKKGYLVNVDNPDFYIDLIITYSNEQKIVDTIVPQIHPFPYRVGGNYYPTVYAPKLVKYVEDNITINMVDRVSNKLILSITSKADINIGNTIPDSSSAITRNLMIKFLRMRKEAIKNFS